MVSFMCWLHYPKEKGPPDHSSLITSLQCLQVHGAILHCQPPICVYSTHITLQSFPIYTQRWALTEAMLVSHDPYGAGHRSTSHCHHAKVRLEHVSAHSEHNGPSSMECLFLVLSVALNKQHCMVGWHWITNWKGCGRKPTSPRLW